MKAAPLSFLVGGLATALVAGFVAQAFAGGFADQTASMLTGAVLAVGNAGAALWAAGAEERKTRLLTWARVGLVGAALSFVALYAVAAPALRSFLSAPSPTPALYGILALALALTSVIIWFSLRLAWRRAAPKDAAR